MEETVSKVSSSYMANSIVTNTCPGRIWKSDYSFRSLGGTQSCWVNAMCKVDLQSVFLFECLAPEPYTFSAPGAHEKAKTPNAPPPMCPTGGNSVLLAHLSDFCWACIPCTEIHCTLLFKSTSSRLIVN